MIHTQESFVRNMLVPLTSGLVFGFALERGKVYLPQVIQAQMLFTSFTMLKMFLAATTAGMACIAVLERFPTIKSRIIKPPTCFGMGVHGYGNNILGGALLGVGMTLSGACPGTILAQLGAGLVNPWAIAGSALGAVMVGPVSKALRGVAGSHGSKAEPKTLDQAVGKDYTTVSMAVAGLFLTVVLAAEAWIDWKADLAVTVGPTSVLGSWNPIVSGLVLGSLQLPLLGVAGEKMLGTSRGWATVMGELAGKAGYGKESGVVNPEAWWQVVMDLGIVAGARLSVSASGFVPPPVAGSALSQFLGGFLILFGGRLGGGCTSGHGLSGMAQLSLASFVTVAAMFGGGMASAALLL